MSPKILLRLLFRARALACGRYPSAAIASRTRFLVSTALTEGNHYETENRYTVFLYAKTPADIYESLIAVLEVK